MNMIYNDAEQIFREALKEYVALKKSKGVDQETIAKKELKRSPSFLSGLLTGKKSIGKRLRKYLIKKLDTKFEEAINQITTELRSKQHPPQIISDIELPVVSRAITNDMDENLEFFRIEGVQETIEFKKCKAIEVLSNSMSPFVLKGQKIIISEVEDVRNGDLVFVKLKNGMHLFRKYFKKKFDHMNIITLQSINNVIFQEPIFTTEDEIAFCHRVVGIKF